MHNKTFSIKKKSFQKAKETIYITDRGSKCMWMTRDSTILSKSTYVAVSRCKGKMLYYVLLTLLITGCRCNLIVEIDSINGNDSIACTNGTTKSPCKSLNYVFENIKNMSYSTLKILKGEHILFTEIRVNGIFSMEIVSFGNALLKCVNSSGLTFISSSNVTVRGVTLKHCGAKHNKIEYKNKGNFYHSFMSTAICFIKCKDVVIDNVVFQENEGVALAFFNVGNTVQIYQSFFISNVNYLTKENISVGGGVYVEISNYTSLNSFINTDTKYLIKKCNFSNNFLVSGLKQTDMSTKVQKNIYARGAGLSIVLKEDARRIFLNIIDCLFINNTAVWGGGMFLYLAEKSENNSLLLIGCLFEANIAVLAGGGIRIYEESKQITLLKENSIKLENILFKKNSAIWGGGVSIKGATQNKYESLTTNTIFERCVFDENYGTVGFAIGLHTRNFKTKIFDRGVSYRVIMNNCLFNKNQMTLSEDKKVRGQGCIYFKEAFLVLTGNNSFTCNQGTAVVLESASLTFGSSSYSLFQNNTGTEGGAIALYGTSWLELEKKCSLLFERNSALRRGGALFVKHAGPPRVGFQNTELQSSPCFIRYNDMNTFEWPVNITFRENYAPPSSGKSIYASTLQYCRSDGESRMNSTALAWPFIKYESVGTDPEIVTSPIELNFNKEQWNVSPFFSFSTDVHQLDERGQSVYGSVKIDINSENKSVTLDPPNYDFIVRDKISKLKILGKTLSKFSVTLITNNDQLVVSPTYNVSLSSCLPGFRLKGNKCVCMDAEVGDVVHCLENGTVYVLRGRWGYVNSKTSLLETVVCPQSYCKCHIGIEEYLCQFNVKEQCSKNRRGRLCSQCAEGYSVAFFNEDCKICTTNWWFVLFLGIAIVVSFFLILALSLIDVDEFFGYFNVFFYWYQMIDLIIPVNVQLTRCSLFIIGIFSLNGTGGNTGICLFNGLNNLCKIFLNYVPTGIFLITAFALPFDWLPKCFCCNMYENLLDEETHKMRKTSRGKIISFVIVVTFSQIIIVSIRLLHFVEIDGQYYLYKAAFARFCQYPHIFFALFAVFLLAAMFVFTLLLVIGPKNILLTKFNIVGNFYFKYLAPVFDALKSCFDKFELIGNDNSKKEEETRESSKTQRGFAIFYFILRVLMIIFSVIAPNEIIKLSLFLLVSVISLAVFASFQPYRERCFNIWNTLALTFMCIATLISLVLSVPFSASQTLLYIIKILFEIIIWLPFVTLITRIGWTWPKLLDKRFSKSSSLKEENDKTSVCGVPIRASEHISNENIIENQV
ncbi:uncharacterized protein LOC136089367 [Hydra vulgaris]|uniref:Uncharacterized protein LOC136089367 n=1 Tax=Hydra vulgaris TaxID=6087 RepID=A0ABM4DAM4_HYDVU